MKGPRPRRLLLTAVMSAACALLLGSTPAYAAPLAGPTRGEANAAFQSNFTGGFAIRTHNLEANGAPGGPAIPTPDSARIYPGEPNLECCAQGWHVITLGVFNEVRQSLSTVDIQFAHRDQEVAAPVPRLLRESALGSDVRGVSRAGVAFARLRRVLPAPRGPSDRRHPPFHRKAAGMGGLLQLPPTPRRPRRPNTLRTTTTESPRPTVIGLCQLHSVMRTPVSKNVASAAATRSGTRAQRGSDQRKTLVGRAGLEPATGGL
jgi:hypothetical protein